MSDLEKLKTEIALLKKDAKSGELIHLRLEATIEKLTEITISLKSMLVQQQTKLERAEQVDEDIFITLESRRKEWDNELKELHSRITTNIRELREHQVKSEQTVLNELRSMKHQLSERVGVLEKWRWLIIGGSILLGFMMSNPDSMFFDFFR